MKNLTVLWFLSAFALSCAPAVSQPSREQMAIDPGTVQSVEISQNNREGTWLRLSDVQAAGFAKQWNQARPIGFCKFYATYMIRVRDTNGRTRNFRAMEDTIKEENDYCFVLKDHYIDELNRECLKRKPDSPARTSAD